VLLTPSDHWVGRPAIFAEGIRRATEAVEAGRSDVVLLGVTPERLDPDFGWITLDGLPVDGIAPVGQFVEKPSPKVAQELFAKGAVWNTMILVARVSALVKLFREQVPDLWGALIDAPYTGDLRIVHEHPLHYESVPVADFSRDVIGKATNLSAYVWPETMEWSDLGTPSRLHAWRRSLEPASDARTASVEVSVLA
jgi:mannose-1-phosphate guanylyltransferase